jgi:hypothetical protein
MKSDAPGLELAFEQNGAFALDTGPKTNIYRFIHSNERVDQLEVSIQLFLYIFLNHNAFENRKKYKHII